MVVFVNTWYTVYVDAALLSRIDVAEHSRTLQ